MLSASAPAPAPAPAPLIDYTGWYDGVPEIHKYLSIEGSKGNTCEWVTEWVRFDNMYIALQNEGKVLVSFLSLIE